MSADELQFITIDEGIGSARRIAYRFAPPEPGKPTLLWLCGFKSSMDSEKATALSDWTRQRGLGCLRFDYSGHGLSEGRFEDGTVSRWLKEAESVARLAATPMVLVGSSMGGWIALHLARHLAATSLAPTAIVMIAPAWNMTSLMWDNASRDARETLLREGVYLRPSAYGAPYPITRALIEDGARHLFDDIVHLDMPIRVIHGQQDRDIPWGHSLSLMDRVRGHDMRLTLVKDGEHRLSRPQDLALLFSTLSEFC